MPMEKFSISKFEKNLPYAPSRDIDPRVIDPRVKATVASGLSDEDKFKILVAIRKMFLLQNRKAEDDVLEIITTAVIEQGYTVDEVEEATAQISARKVFDLNFAAIVEQVDINRSRNNRLNAQIKAKVAEIEHDYINTRVTEIVKKNRPLYESRIKELSELVIKLQDVDLEVQIATKKAEIDKLKNLLETDSLLKKQPTHIQWEIKKIEKDLRAIGSRVTNPRVTNPRDIVPRVTNPRVTNPRVTNPRVGVCDPDS